MTVMTSFKHTEVQMREYGSLSLSIRSEDGQQGRLNNLGTVVCVNVLDHPAGNKSPWTVESQSDSRPSFLHTHTQCIYYPFAVCY